MERSSGEVKTGEHCSDPERADGWVADRRTVSRRQFLKMAGIAGTAVGMGAGLGGALTACGEAATTTTTGAATTATSGSATSGAASTTVSTAAETAREIKVGLVSPKTGALAEFGLSDVFNVKCWNDAVKDGVVCGDGKNHPVSFIMEDSQSDGNRCAQVAGDLIQNSKVDILMSAATPDTVCPVAIQAEASAVPFLGTDCPLQAYYQGMNRDPVKDSFDWTYIFYFSIDDWADAWAHVWDKTPTNRVMATMFPNDSDGNADREHFPPIMKAKGFTVVDPGAFDPNQEDFTSIISLLKKEGAELLFGDMNPPAFINFWKQSLQQGWHPKVATMGKALMFASSAEAAGAVAYGMCGECCWSREWPFKSSLTGESCWDLSDRFEKDQKQQWNQAMGIHYMLGEWAVDVLKRTKSVDDKNAIVDAIKTTHLDTVLGSCYYDEPVGTGRHTYTNGVRCPIGVSQWVKGDKYSYDLVIVDNGNFPEIPVTHELVPMEYKI